MANANDPGQGKPKPPSPAGAPRPAGPSQAPPKVAPLGPPAAPPRVAPTVAPVAKAQVPHSPVPKVAPGVSRVAAVKSLGGAPTGTAPSAGKPPAATNGSGSGLTREQLEGLLERTSRLEALDYFEILLLERAAGPADIKKAFYRESRAYHPDRFYQLADPVLKEKVHELYKRVTEAYFVLRDDAKRRKYLEDISGPERAEKLRFNEASEVETKQAVKRELQEQIGTHPKGRQFYQSGVADLEAGRLSSAERNFKTAVTYEPQNARYKEQLQAVQQRLYAESKAKGDSFKIK